MTPALNDGLNAAEVKILESLTVPACVVVPGGRIVRVNTAWRDSAREAGRCDAWVGWNYLDVCRAAVGPDRPMGLAVEAGLRAVLAGQAGKFEANYCLPTPQGTRHYLLMALPFSGGCLVQHLPLDVDEVPL